jgi:hypothetical protein
MRGRAQPLRCMNPRRQALVLIALASLTSLAIAQEKPPASEQTKEFKPPPGFAIKKRGKLVLYCKRDTEIGTRFKTERCYSEDQVRDYVMAQRENKRDIDKIRSTCAAGGDPCVFK